MKKEKQRYSELRKSMPHISDRQLAATLRELEKHGMITRKVYAEVPPRVEYSLTEHGVSLNAALADLGAWGVERIRRIGAEKVVVATA